MNFIIKAMQLEEQGDEDGALDLIYDSVYEMCRVGEFMKLNEFLRCIRLEDCSINIWLGILTSTHPAKNKLPYRSEFFTKVKDHLKETDPNRVEDLLRGLE